MLVIRLFPICLFTLLFFAPALSQVTDNQLYSVSGIVVNEKGISIPFSSITLYRSQDSARIAALAADKNGQFRLTASPGSYYLVISFLSYEEKKIPGINVENKNIDLGAVALKASAKLLEEVVVTSEKKLMELQLDKRVYNVSRDVSNIGANASEILANIPSVTVDIDGNVSLRGSEGVRILIDGKPSALTGIRSTDALRNLQGAMIERIEVITNPSSRYDAAGETGIINIILKKNKTKGFNGNFTGTAGYPSNFSGAYSINYRTQKMNLFSSFGANYRKHPGKGFSTQQFSGTDTSFMYNQTTDRTRQDYAVNLVAGIDYYFTPSATLTASVLIDGGMGKNVSNILYEDLSETGQLVKKTLRTDNEKEKETDTEFSFSFRKKYPGNDDKEWTADFKWTNSGETENSDYLQHDMTAGEILRQRSNNPAYEDNLLFQTDYSQSAGNEGKFETGLKGTIRRITNEYLVEQQVNGNEWIALPAFDNNMKFTERIAAAYAILSNKIKKVEYQLGLRGELTDMETGLLKTGQVNKRTYFNLFPSGNLSYQSDDKNTWQLSYSYRINRPHFRNLTPFADFSDPRIFFTGNPGLRPEYAHAIETGHLLDWGKGSVLSGIYYRHKKGVVERIRILDTTTGITNIVPVNLSTQKDWGAELTLTLALSSWWKFNSNVNVFRSVSRGVYNDELLESKTFSWTNRTTSRMTFFKKVDFQASVNYRSPRVMTQGKDLSVYSIDLGLAADVFKGKGTLTFNLRDLMNSRKRRSVVDIPGYYSRSAFQWRPRQLTLTLNFRLNQQKIEQKEERNNDEGSFEN